MAKSFSSFVGDFGDWSWVVLFAHSSFDSVLAAYADIVGNPPSEVSTVASGKHHANPSGSVIELPGTEWTMILHLVGAWDEFDFSKLADKLNARVIAYEAEDTSGSSQCTDRASDGTLTRIQDKAAAESAAELEECMEDFAEEMGAAHSSPPPVIIDSYDDFLMQQGITLVNLSFNEDYSLAVVDPGIEASVGRVGRVAGN